MSYIILVNDDDTLYGSHKERIMQRSKLVDNLVFLVNPIYRKTINMTGASVMLEYVLPVSKKYETINLVLSKEKYNNCYLQYKLPFDTNLTSEAGDVELQLTFAYADLDENGKGIQRVRKTSKTTINIVPISAWSDIIPDSALTALDQRLIKVDAQIKALNDYANTIGNNMVDNLKFDTNDDTLQLLSKNNGVGNKISVKEMLKNGVPVLDLNSPTSGGPDGNQNNGCACGDNVVEFK